MSTENGKKALLWLRAALTGEQCVSCGRYDTHGLSLLCPSCRQSLTDSMSEKCPLCGKSAVGCLCMTDGMDECGASALIKLGFYDARDREAALNRIILRLKDMPDRMLARMLAPYALCTLTDFLEKNGISREETVFTYIPRSRSRAAETGTDQAKLLSRAIASEGGYGCIEVISRSKANSSAQKTLTASERKSNAKGVYSVKKGERIFGRTVVIVDDLVTTGSTMKECIRICSDAGARRIICLCIGRASFR